jgi:hypothetical protein
VHVALTAWHYTQVLCQYWFCKATHAYLAYLMLQRQLSHFNGCKVDHGDVKPFIFFELSSNIFLPITTRQGPLRKYSYSIVALLRICFLATGFVSLFVSREHIYRAVDQKLPKYIGPSRGRCIATALHATIYGAMYKMFKSLRNEFYYQFCH